MAKCFSFLVVLLFSFFWHYRSFADLLVLKDGSLIVLMISQFPKHGIFGIMVILTPCNIDSLLFQSNGPAPICPYLFKYRQFFMFQCLLLLLSFFKYLSFNFITFFHQKSFMMVAFGTKFSISCSLLLHRELSLPRLMVIAVLKLLCKTIWCGSVGGLRQEFPTGIICQIFQPSSKSYSKKGVR